MDNIDMLISQFSSSLALSNDRLYKHIYNEAIKMGYSKEESKYSAEEEVKATIENSKAMAQYIMKKREKLRHEQISTRMQQQQMLEHDLIDLIRKLKENSI